MGCFSVMLILTQLAVGVLTQGSTTGDGRTYINARRKLSDGSFSNTLNVATQLRPADGGSTNNFQSIPSATGNDQFVTLGGSGTGSGIGSGINQSGGSGTRFGNVRGQFSGSSTGSGNGQFISSGSGSTGQFVTFGGTGTQTEGGSGFFVSQSADNVQTGTGSVIGQVSGGVVPGVTVTVRDNGATVTRVVQQNFTPTVTQTSTVDHFVTRTDVAFQSVEVTLTTLLVQTVTSHTTVVLHTPVNDRVALQTSVVLRPSTITITQVKTDFNLVTAVSVDRFTITHHTYIIRHSTLTTTATQTVRVTSTLVQTLIHTTRNTSTRLHTITDTVLVSIDPIKAYY